MGAILGAGCARELARRDGTRGGRRARVSLIVGLTLALGTAGAAAQGTPPKWGAHIDLEGKAGNKRNIGEADLFMPLWQNDRTLVFGNVRTRLDDDDSKEGNFGAGVRHMLESGWNLGGYGYFDRRKTEHDNYFNQVTLGVEALSADWDFRANTYIPEGRRIKNVEALNTAEISGTSVIFRGGEERSLNGVDIEAGWRVPVFGAGAGKQLRVYGGAYRFWGEGVNPVQGPRGRAELTFDEVPGLWEGSRLTLGAEAQHDGPRGGQVFAVARLRIPLQVFGETRSNLTPLERRMTDPTVRDVDVVSQAGALGAPEAATQLANGSTFSVLNSASTDGNSLDTAVAAAGNNSSVILSGTFQVTAGNQITMQNGQTLMAGAMTVRSPSGRLATLTASATISGSGMTDLIEMPGNTTLQGLTLSNARSDGTNVRVVNLQNTAANISILNNTITATQTGTNAAQALVAGNVTNVTISGNTLTATASSASIAQALAITAGTTATVTGNTLSASSGGGTASYVLLNSANIQSGSTGNVAVNGACTIAGAGTGTVIGFTNAADCGP